MLFSALQNFLWQLVTSETVQNEIRAAGNMHLVQRPSVLRVGNIIFTFDLATSTTVARIVCSKPMKGLAAGLPYFYAIEQSADHKLSLRFVPFPVCIWAFDVGITTKPARVCETFLLPISLPVKFVDELVKEAATKWKETVMWDSYLGISASPFMKHLPQ